MLNTFEMEIPSELAARLSKYSRQRRGQLIYLALRNFRKPPGEKVPDTGKAYRTRIDYDFCSDKPIAASYPQIAYALTKRFEYAVELAASRQARAQELGENMLVLNHEQLLELIDERVNEILLMRGVI